MNEREENSVEMPDMADVIGTKSVLVVGCGGLGGFVIDELSRIGVGKLILVDGDVFCQSNMNRQLLANTTTLGKYKAETYAKWVKKSAKSKVEFYNEFLAEGNLDLIDKADLVMDCVDSVKTRRLLAAECRKRGKILIHGAVEGEEGQVMLCFPEDDSLERLFKNAEESEHSTVSYAVATVASIQTAFAVKALNGHGEKLRNKLVLIDLESLYAKTLDF